MIVFPAIDLIAGQVVRLQRGDRSRMDVYSDDPAAVAESFREAGAAWIHVVNLSAAFGEDEQALAANAAAIRAIAAVEGIKVDAGGGGTVAMYMANRNISTLDAGVPVLSMHAPYETVSKLDCYETYNRFDV